jgi:hypothetical protein
MKEDSCEDEFYHLEDGQTIMTYRLLHNSTMSSTGSENVPGTTPSSSALLKNAEVLKVLEQHAPTQFMLVVVPDLFQTLDTLKEACLPLLSKHPLGRLLLVGLPGLPRTLWAKGTLLNNELHAKCLSRLLEHLARKSFWVPDPQIPLLFLGAGNGANVLTLFAAAHLPAPRHLALKQATRVMVLVNGFVCVDLPLKRTLVALKRTLKRSMSHHERMRHLTSLLFSSDYLGHATRAQALELFWATRHDISALTTGLNGQDLCLLLLVYFT